VVAPSVWCMPVMIEKGQVQAHGTGGADSERPVSTEPGRTRASSCECDECQTRARDEMWTRWA
jgi:hypothetical protein